MDVMKLLRMWIVLPAIVLWFTPAVAGGVENVSLQRGGREVHVVGKVLVEAQDGGMLLVARDGNMWIIQPEELVRRESDRAPFEPLTQDEMAQQLLREMPAGFRIHQTANYVICYNTTTAYAEWCGGLYERLNRAFFNYWKNRGFELHDPEFPLVALVFDTQASYLEYSRRDLGTPATNMIGYYNLQTNRVTMYDLTGVDNLRQNGRRTTTAAHVNQILSQPQAERTVATIVHEATHQLAYNSGLQTRLADNPFWVSEGIAVYFETPDLKSSRGWRNIGAVNRFNLFQFRKSLRTRPQDSLITLLSDDRRFRDAKAAPTAYAEAWALNYYLIRTHREQYAEYLQRLAQLQPLEQVTPQQRLAQFQQVFGDDLHELEADFLRYMRRVR
jgi:hypothetical protein